MTDENVSVIIDVLANDSDPDGIVLAVIDVTDSPYGETAIVPPEGAERTKVRFTPHPGAVGVFEFDTVILDDDGGQSVGRVEVTVLPVNEPPLAGDDTATTKEGEPVTIDVLANDTDPDGDVLSVLSFTEAADGHVVNLGDGVRYEPDPGFHGSDAFTYVADDGHGGSATASVEVVVEEINDPPVIPPREVVRVCCLPQAIDVLAEASDPDGEIDAATLAIGQGPRNGTASVDAEAGTVTYTPRLLFTGGDSLTVTVHDDAGLESEPALIDITVLGGFINEVVPAESRIELYNPSVPGIDITGWKVAGYEIGSDPARESYGGTTEGVEPPSAESFDKGAIVVVSFPGVDLLSLSITVRDARGTRRDSLDLTSDCYARADGAERSLSRSSDGFRLADPCDAFAWTDADSLGVPNP